MTMLGIDFPPIASAVLLVSISEARLANLADVLLRA
jgi:hypothetical protein